MNKNQEEWVSQVYEKILQKMNSERNRNHNIIPYVAENDRYVQDMSKKDIVWWTNGFWAGIMWQLFVATQDEAYRKTAILSEEKLDEAFNIYTGLHHDVGFMWLHTAVAHYRIEKDERSLARGLHAAHLLAGRYNPNGKFIRSWNRNRSGWVIIDSMLNIPLLYWAGLVIDDPRFVAIAKNHADTVMNTIVRPDGSVNHIVVFDPNTGEVLGYPAGQGYESGSSWTRGQAWAIYGFVLSYIHTGETKYLDTAKRVAHYFIANVSLNHWQTNVDFRSPNEKNLMDSSAGACAACGLIELSKNVSDLESELYLQAAINILQSIEQHDLDWNISTDGLVKNATAAYHDENNQNAKIIYADYFFIEAIFKLKNTGFLIW